MMQASWITAAILTFAIPIFSALVLITWWTWFRRHRDLYNLRNEVLHRIELDLKMYHFLRAVEANSQADEAKLKRLATAKKAAGYDDFEPFYTISKLSGPSGFRLAALLAFGIPAIQFVLLLALALSASAQRNIGSAAQTETPSPSQSVTSPKATPSQIPKR